MADNNLFLPDTNIFIYALSGQPPYSIWLKKLIENKKLAISAMVVAEFIGGAKETELVFFKDILNRFGVYDIDNIVAQVAGEYRNEFSKKTKKVWLIDCLIAATCKVNGLVLVTANKKDYPMTDINIQTPK